MRVLSDATGMGKGNHSIDVSYRVWSLRESKEEKLSLTQAKNEDTPLESEDGQSQLRVLRMEFEK